jgi:hypothetical protein
MRRAIVLTPLNGNARLSPSLDTQRAARCQEGGSGKAIQEGGGPGKEGGSARGQEGCGARG